MKREFSANIIKHDDKTIEVIAIRSGDFGDEGVIPAEEIQRCHEKIKGLSVFFSHQRTSEDLLGIVTDTWLEEEKVMARITLYSDTLVQQNVISHIKRGNINAVSLGFRCGILPLYEGKELLVDIVPEELSIIGLYPEVPVCDTCLIVEKNFGVEESKFVSMNDSELLIAHLLSEINLNEKNHKLIIDEMRERRFYHAME